MREHRPGAAALGLLLIPLRRLLPEDNLFMPAALAISLLPMFLVNVSRIANDGAGAVSGRSGCFTSIPRFRARRPWLRGLAAGIFLGAGLLTKLTILGLLPTTLAYYAFLCLSSRMSWRTGAWCALGTLTGCLAIAGPHLAFNLLQFGVPFVAQETILNAASGRTPADLLRAVRWEDLPWFFCKHLVRNNLWTSGWSFLAPSHFLLRLYGGFWIGVLVAGAVAVYRMATKRSSYRLAAPDALVFCVLLVVFTFLAAYAEALHTILAFGGICTQSYYVMPAYPALLACAFALVRSYGRIPLTALAMSLAALFLLTEYHSLLAIAVPHWAGTKDLGLAFDRLAGIHPRFPSPTFFPLLAVLVLLGNLFLGALCLSEPGTAQSVRNRRQSGAIRNNGS